MEKKIFIDSDGVLRDFVGACEKRYKRQFNFSENKNIQELLGFDGEQWESELDNFKFWADMKPTVDAKDLMKLLKTYFYAEQIYIITSAQQTPCAISGCTSWYKKYLPSFKDRIIYAKDKSLFAKPNHILIDDFQKEYSNFSKAGGWAILFPRPWNMYKMTVHPLAKVQVELELILYSNREIDDGEERILTLSSPL